MDIRQLNIWAILVAAISAFVVGGLWYSVLFGTAWKKANGFTDASVPKGNGRLLQSPLF